MKIFTIGYTQKTAKRFFELIKSAKIDVLIDIRLWNNTQLAGFSKARDLEFFLGEICNCDYIYAPQFAPTAELLNGYREKSISWQQYEVEYPRLITMRGGVDWFAGLAGKNVCLLCAEPTAEQCHRRLLAEMIGGDIVHL